MALDRRSLRRSPGLSFAKTLGCGKGETFTPSDLDISRWGFIFTIDESHLEYFDNSKVVTRWRERAQSEFRVLLDPLSSRGSWSGVNPFTFRNQIATANSEVVAITRARISWRQSLTFWRAVPPVTHSLRLHPGLLAAFGIGEAPIGLQGTFSHWISASALREFAYQGDAHKEVIAATQRSHWYTEELFARFSVREVRGSLGADSS